ncbi:DinB family protein [Tautonia sociabilis]|uniref:DinB family protein n=1 Tax=Tautonia sociabilis TaxID=2080755 RepID=A0A432MND6_9BACT|nr:DinB family protein [Tautonia sociabilis]RUL88954.1 DinB family protein [Tautonia sociabilis]
MSRLALLINQIGSSRRYTENLIATIDPADWYRMPGGVSHICWQVGHLAMAEYRLAIQRIRGRREGDDAIIPEPVLGAFGRGSVPSADGPAPEEIRAIFDRVHERTMAELAGLPESALDEPPEVPHPLCATKGDALSWCSRHEMIHAGQIALLRRLLGGAPLW